LFGGWYELAQQTNREKHIHHHIAGSVGGIDGESGLDDLFCGVGMILDYELSYAMVNLEEKIEQHATLALAQVQAESYRAMRHIYLMLEFYKAEDVFENRSRGQLRRWAAIKGEGKC
jgi:hypothetical protein